MTGRFLYVCQKTQLGGHSDGVGGHCGSGRWRDDGVDCPADRHDGDSGGGGGDGVIYNCRHPCGSHYSKIRWKSVERRDFGV